MNIDIRAVRRLRESAGARAALGPLVEALCRSDADLAATRVVCDWIQYKSNFRDTVTVRPVIAADVPGEVTAALSGAVHVTGGAAAGADGPGADEYRGGAGDRAWLEPWVPGSA